jgi:menaquinone-dependent protoporphyrinogen oxidase
VPKVLILYASNHGHTARIASRIADVIRESGAMVDVRDVDAAGELAPPGYDAVLVGASVHAGHHQRTVVDWVKRHATTLNGMPSAFFSVCLTAAEDTEESREATRKYTDDFLDDTGWNPLRTEAIAGALQYREYDVATRVLMRLLMKRGHHPTDTSRDHDYTDWDDVARFAREFAAMAGVAEVGASR